VGLSEGNDVGCRRHDPGGSGTPDWLSVLPVPLDRVGMLCYAYSVTDLLPIIQLATALGALACFAAVGILRWLGR